MNRNPLLKAGALLLVTATFTALGVGQERSQGPSSQECTVPAYTGKDLDKKPKILAKPQPKFSGEERRKFEGKVITLRALLCGAGKVTDIEVKDGLADGPNEKAIEAARRIEFIPAEKDGNKVSRFVFLNYIVR